MATSGVANRVGGGGGYSSDYTLSRGYGGSGVVIIRYITGTINATGGTVTTSGSYTIHKFTSSGTFTASAPISGKKINGIIYMKWNGIEITKFNNQ